MSQEKTSTISQPQNGNNNRLSELIHLLVSARKSHHIRKSVMRSRDVAQLSTRVDTTLKNHLQEPPSRLCLFLFTLGNMERIPQEKLVLLRGESYNTDGKTVYSPIT